MAKRTSMNVLNEFEDLNDLDKIVVDKRNSKRSDSKKGEPKKTRNSSTQLGDMPRGTKRQAMKTEYLEYYVKFKIRVGVNKTMTVGNQFASYSRLKPFVRVKMKAFGVDRRVKRRKNIRLGGFKSIGSVNMNVGGTTMTQTNALPIEEIMDMIFKGLVKFKEKVK